MIYPKFISNNSTIGIICPSGGSNRDTKINKYKNGIKRFSSLGFKLKISDNIFNNYMQRSADAKSRAKEFNDYIKDSEVDLILCATGGEFLVEILPYVDFDLIKNNTKFICGFSDPTGLLYPLTTKYDVSTIYGQNFSPFGMMNLHKSQEDFLNIITGKTLKEEGYPLFENERKKEISGLEDYYLTEKTRYKTLDNKDVCVSGRIIGGCMDILSVLSGTKYDGIDSFNQKYKDDGIIWYFDNCELSCEEVIRVLWKFNELGFFKYTKCIIFGRFGLEISNSGYDTYNCLKDSVLTSLDIPVIYGADVSHKSPCLTIINGSIANIKLKNNKFSISFELK